MKKAYGAYQNTDLNEGRGPLQLAALFFEKKDAQRCSDNLGGVMGSKNDCEVREFTVFENYLEYDPNAKHEKAVWDQIRETALSKLTNDEKQALGVK
jgi:hypothetical protein